MTTKTGLHKWFKRGFMALLSLTIITLMIVISQTATTTNSDTQQTILAQFDPSTYPELNSPNAINTQKALLIPAADFTSNFVSAFSLDGGYVQSTSNGQVCLRAPAYLPVGAKLDSFVVYAYDNSSTSDFTLYLRRKSIGSTDTSEILKTATVSGMSTTIQVIVRPFVPSQPIVESSYAYYISGCLGSDTFPTAEHRIYAVIINYS